MSDDGGAHLRRSTGIDAVELDGDVLLYDGRTLQLLEGVAAYLWRSLDGRVTVPELVRTAAADFAAPLQQVDQDVRGFLADLEQQGLVERSIDERYVPGRAVGWVRDGDAVLLIDLATGHRATLTTTGGSLWEALMSDGRLTEAAERLRDQYPDAPDDLHEVLAVLVGQLAQAGFLRSG